MKRFFGILALSLLMVVMVSTVAAAAPTAVSLKAGAGVGFYGLEVTLPMSDNLSIVVEGGTTYPIGSSLVGFDYLLAGLGARYYFTPEGWRPFATLYGVYNYDLTGIGADGMSVIGTGGVEFQRESGLRFAIELGGSYNMYFNSPALNNLGFIWGIALGYGF